MQSYELQDLLEQASSDDQRYLEFLRHPSMSLGIYQLAAGAEDLQGPHRQDEVYYVISGSAKLRVKDELQPIKAGSVLFVAAGDEHQFIDIKEDLNLLVFFAPAEE